MPLDVDRAHIQAVLAAAYGLHLQAPLRELPAGVHSRAWLVTADDGAWVARVSDHGIDSAEQFRAEAMLYAFLNAHGINAPTIRPDHHGRSVVLVDTPRQPRALVLMRFHDLGRFDAHTIGYPVLQHIGGTIAQLHTLLDSFPGRSVIEADVTKAHNEWGQQRQGAWADLATAPLAERFSNAELAWLQTVDGTAASYLARHYPPPASLSQVVLHGDLNFEHLRPFRGNQLYMFDFGDMCWGPAAHELGQLLQCLFRDSAISVERWEDLRAGLIDGYIHERALTPDDRSAVAVFVVNRIVAQAKYIVDLTEASATPSAAAVIKRTYVLAEHVVRQEDR